MLFSNYSYLYVIGLMSRVFANGPGDQGSISGQRLKKWYLLNTQHYKVRIKGKVEQLHLCVVAIERGAFGSPLTKVTNFTLFLFNDFSQL